MSSNKKYQDWYCKTKQHWAESDNTLKGILGGYDEVHESDVKTSSELLEGLINLQELMPFRAIDCGAGIGRVVKSVLINYFDEVDIVEQEEKFVYTCNEEFKGESKVKDIYQASLQQFQFKKKYDLIWIQWCMENLEDKDLLSFLIRCKDALTKKGMIIAKENLSDEDKEIYSSVDNSKVRTLSQLQSLFKKSGLIINRQFYHPNWPEDLLSVGVFVLKLH